ncbi:hypothetical protein K1719_031980 [Acacia pycnantha]|nr:hypothetical protein K1719_031980 [Acacia pycnantha]
MESRASQDSALRMLRCAYYELPVGGKLIPGLLHGLNLPEKRISGGNIMDTIMWHERSRYQYEDKYRNANNKQQRINDRGKSNEGSSRSRFQSSSSSGGSVVYKGAGVGWSTSGSGGGDHHYVSSAASSRKLSGSIAVEMKSENPYNDFKQSILQIIIDRDICSTTDLRELLQCFLQLNLPCHHQLILKAFSHICQVDSPPSSIHANVSVL